MADRTRSVIIVLNPLDSAWGEDCAVLHVSYPTFNWNIRDELKYCTMEALEQLREESGEELEPEDVNERIMELLAKKFNATFEWVDQLRHDYNLYE